MVTILAWIFQTFVALQIEMTIQKINKKNQQIKITCIIYLIKILNMMSKKIFKKIPQCQIHFENWILINIKKQNKKKVISEQQVKLN